MNKNLAAYLAAVATIAALDMLWLGVLAKSIYQQGIGHLMADKPNIAAAISFYLLYPIGLLIFVVIPAGDDAPLVRTALVGALFGFFAYATYDLSNLATLRNWPVGLTLIDLAWGTLLTALTAVAGKAVMNWAAS